MCVLPALRQHGAHILPESWVLRLETGAKREIQYAKVLYKGQVIRIRAKVFVLALGAVLTPCLLLRSNDTFPEGLGNESGMVGRNLMAHVSDRLLMAFSADNSSLNNGVSVNDFYTRDGVKLGNIHAHAMSFPVPKDAGTVKCMEFSTVVEDFPYLCNRVYPASNSETDVIWEYHLTAELGARADLLTNGFIDALHKSGNSVSVGYQPGRLNGSHICGTCRFGADSRTSVLDPVNRVHSLDNVYVVDASFFPSSGGINPSLTIVANALRVSDSLASL
jgi:choline dehydrogenase-like flavoprotein